MGTHPVAEPALVERARSGDRNAQQVLWRMHRRWVAAIVMVHRPRAVEVDDLMQEVAIKFISKVQTLRDPGAFRPWLRQIVINVCRGAARSLRPTLHLAEAERDAGEHARGDGVSVVVSRDDPGESRGEHREEAQRLLDHLLTLPSDYREPLILRCVRSMTYQQISEILDLPITTIETRLARARRMLREEIGEVPIASG
ncbi:MAG: RNA polymerase sigma factor [Planctomycetota bacterium]|jgi:RNA polymerase sigma-70 factor (ECF subfamily)